MKKVILHIDFDSFFASAEQQLNPLYRNRPIGVTATASRTCIIAASREAKALGIKSPSRTFDARRICPQIIFVPAHFTTYWEISKKFINICKDFSPFVEIFSLDEIFMDITQTAGLFGGTYPLIENIKNRLECEIGSFVTASFGISHNKLLAKLASGLEKPNGLVEIKEADITDIYQKARLTDICGIGFRIEKRLNQMGIYTLLKLRTTPLSALVAEFGEAEGNFLYQAGKGIDTQEVVPYTEAPDVKSVGRSYCLPRNEYDQRVVMQNVFELFEEIGIKLRRLNKKARRVGIYLRGDESFSARKTYSNYMDQGKELFEASLSLLNSENSEYSDSQMIRQSGNQNFRSTDILSFPSIPNYVRQIGVWASNLSDADRIPSSLFETSKHSKLLKAVDSINEKFGPHTLRNGFLLYADKLTTVPNGFMADRYERVKYAKEQSQALS